MPVCHAAPRASRGGAGVGAITTHLTAASTSTNANTSAKCAVGEGGADEYDFSTFTWVNPRSGLWPS